MMSLDTVRQSYDETPYEDMPFFFLHPDVIGTTASLFGLDPAPADRCRVLEIGCASGVNLMAMAQYLRESRFVGIDLSPVQIAAGKERAAAAGLSNVALHACAVGDFPADAGAFDYVLCHGVYTWVPPQVQGEILAAVKRHLAPGGVGYVSYNTLPGWHSKRIISDIVQYAGRKNQGAQARLEAGLAFLKLLLETLPASEGAYDAALRHLGPLVLKDQPIYLIHEFLEGFNAPLYFHEFAAALANQRLQYLSEVAGPVAQTVLPRQVTEAISRWADDLTEWEQALDFCVGRTFRQSLVCHADVKLSRPAPEVMRRYYYSACAKPVEGPKQLDAETNEKFETPWKKDLSTTDPLLRATVYTLGEVFPRSLAFTELIRSVAGKLSALPAPGPVAGPDGEAAFAAGLLGGYAASLLRPHRWRPPVAEAVPERPRVAAFNRSSGPSMGPVANPYHVMVPVTDFERLVLGLCDGSRDRAGLTAALGAKIRAGEFGTGADVPIAEVVASLPGCVDDCLNQLQQKGLFLPAGS
jgi:SAM-dependent methyltransferase